MIVFTIKELKTTTNTALNARQKWHLFLTMSLHECLHKKLQAEQQPFDLALSVSLLLLTASAEVMLPKPEALLLVASDSLTFHFAGIGIGYFIDYFIITIQY